MAIFISDHSEVFRLGLTGILKNLCSDTTISGGESVEVLLNQMEKSQTDLVIIQQSSDAIRGHTEIISLKSLLRSGTKVLVLSDQPSLLEAKTLFGLGIKGYADRASPIEIISEAIKLVLSGKAYIEASLLIKYLDSQYNNQNQLFKKDSQRLLTGKELQIAEYLVQGFKTTEISKLLSKKPTTISTQKANIYQKLGVRNVVELLECMNGMTNNGIPRARPANDSQDKYPFHLSRGKNRQ
jgi:two-component system invasion response regulator UvrY